MSKRHGSVNWLFTLLTCAALVSVAPAAQAGNRDAEFPITPKTHDGARWKIGYYEGGQYADYEVILKQTVRGLIKLGWMSRSR